MSDVGVEIDPTAREAARKQIGRWKETGFGEDAVAVYGASVNYLQRAIVSGKLPAPYTGEGVTYPYQSIYRGEGEKIYYLLPFYSRLVSAAPDLAQRLKAGMVDYNGIVAEQDLVDRPVLRSARAYALESSLTDGFYEMTGKRVSEKVILSAGERLGLAGFRNLKTDYASHVAAVTDDVSDDEDIVGQLKRDVGLENIEEVLANVLRRRGVLIFINGEIFAHRVVPGHEAPQEIMVIAKDLMPITTVSGVKFVGENDEAALMDKIG